MTKCQYIDIFPLTHGSTFFFFFFFPSFFRTFFTWIKPREGTKGPYISPLTPTWGTGVNRRGSWFPWFGPKVPTISPKGLRWGSVWWSRASQMGSRRTRMWPRGSLMEPMDLLACYSCPGFPRWDTRDLESSLGILELYKGTPNRAKGLTDGDSLSVWEGL